MGRIARVFPGTLAGVVGALYLLEGGAFLCVVGASGCLLHTYRRHGDAHERRQLLLAVAMNAVTVVVSIMVAEMGVRLWTVRTPLRIVFADTLLLPHRWEHVVERNRRLLGRRALCESDAGRVRHTESRSREVKG